jgi:hypothetical protein
MIGSHSVFWKAGSMKRILAIALLLCSTAHAQQIPKIARQLSAPIATTDMVNDGLQPLAHIPWTSDEDIKRSAFGVSSGKDGIVPTGEYPTARYQIAQNYSGAGIWPKAGDARVSFCISRHNYVGARLGSSDSEIQFCRLYNNRDVCLWIAAGSGSANCQSTGNHCYGARIACYNEGSQAYRATQDTYADSLIGYFGDVKVAGSHQTTLTNVLFQHNTVRDCVFGATGGQLMNCIVNIQEDVTEWNTIDIPGVITRSTVGERNAKAGIEMGSRCSIRGGLVELAKWHHPAHTPSGKPCECVRIASGTQLAVINTLLVDGQGIDGAVGVHTVGPCHGLTIDCVVVGFELPADRLLVVDDAAHTNVDITFRINGAAKRIGGYIDIGAGWTGSIRLIDTANGKTMTLPQGKATK